MLFERRNFMKVFVKEKSLYRIRMKLGIIYILNLFDILLTLLFVETNQFIELNPLMKNIVHNSTMAMVVKCVIPAVLLGYLAIRLQKANEKQLRVSNVFVQAILILYIAINIIHMATLTIFKVYGIL